MDIYDFKTIRKKMGATHSKIALALMKETETVIELERGTFGKFDLEQALIDVVLAGQLSEALLEDFRSDT